MIRKWIHTQHIFIRRPSAVCLVLISCNLSALETEEVCRCGRFKIRKNVRGHGSLASLTAVAFLSDLPVLLCIFDQCSHGTGLIVGLLKGSLILWAWVCTCGSNTTALSQHSLYPTCASCSVKAASKLSRTETCSSAHTACKCRGRIESYHDSAGSGAGHPVCANVCVLISWPLQPLFPLLSTTE